MHPTITAPRGTRAYYEQVAQVAKMVDRELRLGPPAPPAAPLLPKPPRRVDPASSRSSRSAQFKRSRYLDGKAPACEVCGWRFPVERNSFGAPPGIHAHHVLPVIAGGGDEPENLIVLCPNHHAVVHGIWGTRRYNGPRTRDDLVSMLRRIDEVGGARALVERAQQQLDAGTAVAVL